MCLGPWPLIVQIGWSSSTLFPSFLLVFLFPQFCLCFSSWCVCLSPIFVLGICFSGFTIGCWWHLQGTSLFPPLMLMSTFLPTLSFSLQKFRTLNFFRRGTMCLFCIYFLLKKDRVTVRFSFTCSLSGWRRCYFCMCGKGKAKYLSCNVRGDWYISRVSISREIGWSFWRTIIFIWYSCNLEKTDLTRRLESRSEHK